MSLKVVYAGEDDPEGISFPSILLEGRFPNWQHFGIETLEKLGFEGIVYSPWTHDGRWAEDDDRLYEWMLVRFTRADVIAFWMPNYANLDGAFEISTLHFAEYARAENTVIGFPEVDFYPTHFQVEKTTKKISIYRSMGEVIAEALRLTRL